jgi:hypothetical protein
VKVGNRQAVTPQKALLNRAGLFALLCGKTAAKAATNPHLGSAAQPTP